MSVHLPSADWAPAALSSTPRGRPYVRFAGWGLRLARMGGRGAPRLTQSSLAVGVVGVAYVDRQRPSFFGHGIGVRC
jgi:hypothetical protein